MGGCSGKPATSRSTSSWDLLSSTTWIRGVVTSKRKGVDKFCSFTFTPMGTWRGQEEVHEVSVDYQDSKGKAKSIHMVVRLAEGGPGSELGRELRLRETVLAELGRFQAEVSYKRAKYLVNIPETIFLEQQGTGSEKSFRLVTEDVRKSKGVVFPPAAMVQGGLDLAHTRVVLASLAQLHATTLAWRLSLERQEKNEEEQEQEQSVPLIFPLLVQPLPYLVEHRKKLFLRYERILRHIAPKSKLPRLLEKLEAMKSLSQEQKEQEAERDPLASVGLGPTSPLHLAFTYFLDSDSLPENAAPSPSIAAITRCTSSNFSFHISPVCPLSFSLPGWGPWSTAAYRETWQQSCSASLPERSGSCYL